jgi:hypothetical protein
MSAKKQTAGTPAPSHLDLSTPIDRLPKRWQNAYEKRREENSVKFNLVPGEAAEEARMFVAREMYVEASRKEAEASIVPMFDTRLPKIRRR